MAKYKVEQDHEQCIGCGACVGACPDNWELGDDGKAHPKKTEVDDIGCNQKAADVCPVQIIRIVKQE